MIASQAVESRSGTVVARSVGDCAITAHWPAGSVLFREGEPAPGVFFLQSGKVELSYSSKPLQVVEAGQILGLASVMSGRAQESTATARTACVTGYVEANRFMRLLDQNPSLWISVLQMISEDINACWTHMRAMGAAR